MLKLLVIHALEMLQLQKYLPSFRNPEQQILCISAKTFPYVGGAVLQRLCNGWIYIYIQSGCGVKELEGALAKKTD